jgi:hypothetical protein
MVGGCKASSPTLDEVEEMPDQESSIPHAASFVTALATDAFEHVSKVPLSDISHRKKFILGC